MKMLDFFGDYRKPVSGVLLCLVLLLVACESKAASAVPSVAVNNASPATIPSAGLGSVTTPATLADVSRPALPAFEDKLASLGSYRLVISWLFEGQDSAGAPVTWRVESQEAFVREPPAQSLNLAVEGLLSELDLDTLTVVDVADGAYLWLPGIGCMAGDLPLFEGLAESPIELGSILDGFSVGELDAAKVDIDGVATDRYLLSEGNLPALRDRGFAVAGEVDINVDGGYMSRLHLAISGEGDFLGRGAVEEGRLVLELNLLDVNQPIDVRPPEACLSITAYPLLDDAYQITVLDEFVSYKSRRSLAQAVEYFLEQMPLSGWRVTEVAAEFEDTAYLAFQKENRSVTINIDVDASGKSVTILITP